MCRFDPNLHDEVTGKRGYQPMIMKGSEYKGYCCISEEGYKTKKNLNFG
jgi:hypothetical protein